MKFLQIMGRSGYSSYFSFEFSEHESFGIGDQVWSNGHEVEVAEWLDDDALEELLDMVSNKTSFKGALRRLEIIK